MAEMGRRSSTGQVGTAMLAALWLAPAAAAAGAQAIPDRASQARDKPTAARLS